MGGASLSSEQGQGGTADDGSEWLVTSVRPVYQGFMTLNEYQVELPDGTSTSYAVDDSHRMAAATLLRDGDELVLCRQYRFPLRRWIYDLPGGAGRPGESAEQAAIRECREEVGLEPRNLEPLTAFHPDPGRSSSFVQLFFSNSSVASLSSSGEPSEVVRAVRMPVVDALALLDGDQPLDAALALALHAADRAGLL